MTGRSSPARTSGSRPSVYELENRGVDPRRRDRGGDARGAGLGRARRARHRLRHRLPPAAVRGDGAARVVGVEPHPPLVARPGGGSPAPRRPVRVGAGDRAGAAAAGRARWTWCTRGGRTSSAPAASRGWRSSTACCGRGGAAFVDRQRRDAVDVRRPGSGARCRATTRRRWSGSGPAGLVAAAPRHPLDRRPPEAFGPVVRIEFAAGARRRDPRRRPGAPGSTTRSTSGGGTSERPPDAARRSGPTVRPRTDRRRGRHDVDVWA